METRKHKCPPHHWMIDSNNVGRCRYCPEVRDFGKLQRKADRELDKVRAKGRGKNPYGRRGRPKEEPWEKDYFLG
ncbi:hypothetical protein ES705_13361 [subsurface metagenome]